jgi:hypothetical protein
MTPGTPPSNKARRMLAMIVYCLGILMTLALGAVAIWGDLEASLFDVSIRAQRSLRSLNCPVLITSHETGEISASFQNTGQQPVNRAIRAHISEGFVTLFREENLQLPLQPGERQRWTWYVTADDAAYGSLILVRVSTLRQAPLPSESSTCGILVLNIPWVNGRVVVAGWLILGLAATAVGGWLWLRSTPLQTIKRRPAILSMSAVTLVVIALLLVGLAGLWVVGVLLLALLVLLLITIVAQFLSGS